MKPQYIIAQANSAATLCTYVNDLLEKGYQLVGGLSVTHQRYEDGDSVDLYSQAAIMIPKIAVANATNINLKRLNS